MLLGKPPHGGPGQRQVKAGGDRLGQRPIAVAGDNFHAGSRPGEVPRLLATRRYIVIKPGRGGQGKRRKEGVLF